MMTSFDLAAVSVTALAAAYDLKTGHIPNWLTFGSLIGAIVGHAIFGALQGGALGFGQGLGHALLGVLVCGAVPGLVFFRGGIGGGDVKLFAAIGALCWAQNGLVAETYSFVIALLLAPAYLAYQGRLFHAIGNVLALATNLLRRPEARQPVAPELLTWFRLAPAIFLGTGLMLALGR